MSVGAGVLTLQGKTANIKSRNIALKRCISAEVIVSKQRPVPADLPPASFPYWGGFFRHRQIPSMMCRLCATSLITRTRGLRRPDAILVWITDCLTRSGKEKPCPSVPHSTDAVGAFALVRGNMCERAERRRGAEVGRWLLCLQGANARSSTSVDAESEKWHYLTQPSLPVRAWVRA